MWLDRYMAIPFVEKGRSFAGADCFGLYFLLLQHEAGVGLPDLAERYGAAPATMLALIEAEIASGAWRKIAEGDGVAVKPHARRFDLVHMSGHCRVGAAVVSRDLHVGCALGEGMMIHTELPAPAHVALDDEDVIRRVKAVYRPRVLEL